VLLTEKLLPLLYKSRARRPTVLQVTSSSHWGSDGSDLVPQSGPAPDGPHQQGVVLPPAAAKPGGVPLAFNRGSRGYANSKLAQLYHARSLQKRHPGLRFVSADPSTVGTDLLQPPLRELFRRLGYRADGWGIASALYALFSQEEGEDFFATGMWDYVGYWTRIPPWIPSWTPGANLVRDVLSANAGLSGLVGQHFFRGVGPRRSSVESYDADKAEALWAWSHRALAPYLSADPSSSQKPAPAAKEGAR
jgi:hypothetical protein